MKKYQLCLMLRNENGGSNAFGKWQVIYDGDEDKKGEFLNLAYGNPRLAVRELNEEKGFYFILFQEGVTNKAKDEAFSSIGDFIKSKRKSLGLSLKGLEAISGVGFSAIAKYENEEKEMQVSTLLKLAKALKIDMGEMGFLLNEER